MHDASTLTIFISVMIFNLLYCKHILSDGYIFHRMIHHTEVRILYIHQMSVTDPYHVFGDMYKNSLCIYKEACATEYVVMDIQVRSKLVCIIEYIPKKEDKCMLEVI